MRKLKIVVMVLFLLFMITAPTFAGNNISKCSEIKVILQHKTLEAKLVVKVIPDKKGLGRCPTPNEIYKRMAEILPDYYIVGFNDK